MFPNQLENFWCCTTRIPALCFWVYLAHCSESTGAIVKSPLCTICTKIDFQVYEKLPTSNTHLPFSVLQCSRSGLPPWFLCNMKTEWLAALWPWCQTGGRGTASGGPGCTSGAPHNTCAHPSSRGALLIKHTQQSGHNQGWVFIQ